MCEPQVKFESVLLRAATSDVGSAQLIAQPSPLPSQEFPTLDTSELLGFDFPLRNLMPLFYVACSLAFYWIWLTWMNMHVRYQCWLYGFFTHFSDTPASLMMNSIPNWGVWVWVLYIWCTEPFFRTTNEMISKTPPRYLHIVAAWVCSILTFHLVAGGVPVYLAWREFRLRYLACADQSVWSTSADVAHYLPQPQQKKTNMKQPPPAATATNNDHTLYQVVFPAPAVLSVAITVGVALVRTLLVDAVQSTRELFRVPPRITRQVGIWISFAPLPAPTPRSSFVDWSLFAPYILFTWVLVLNVCVVCWTLSIDSNLRGLLEVFAACVSFVVVFGAPERSRLIYAWLFFNPPPPSNDRMRLRFSAHLVWVAVAICLFFVSTVLVLPETQAFPFPWYNDIYMRIRHLVVNDLHRGEASAEMAKHVLVAATVGLTWCIFFGCRLVVPCRLRRGLPGVNWCVRLAIVAPVFFILLVVWPHVTVPCRVELGAESTRLVQQDLDSLRATTTTPKTHEHVHGCVEAVFSTPYYLPPKYRFGLLANQSAEWPAFVRFNNGAMSKQADAVADVRGMAVKVILGQGEPRQQQDFVATTSNYVSQERGRDYAAFIVASSSSSLLSWALLPAELSWDALCGVARRVRALWLVYRMNRDGAHVTNPLRAEYFSATPYRLGPGLRQSRETMRPATAVKYRWSPCDVMDEKDRDMVEENIRLTRATLASIMNPLTLGWWSSSSPEAAIDTDAQRARDHPRNFLRINLQESLRSGSGGACFDLLLQDQSDACINPIEDSTRVWRGEWLRAARLVIPPQTFLAPAQLDVCRRMGFHTWNALPAHRPLGDINRVLREVQQQQMILTGRELAEAGAGASSLQGNPAMYDYSTYGAPFERMPRKIGYAPRTERMTESFSANIHKTFAWTLMSSVYPRFKLQGEFTRVQDYEFIQMAPPGEPHYENTNRAYSGRMRRPDHVNESVWTTDAWWTQQFLRGLNPMVIQRVTRLEQLPSALAVSLSRDKSKQTYRISAGSGGDGPSDRDMLGALATTGRLFVVDYEELSEAVTFRDRILYAPIVLLCLDLSRVLMPLLIQLERRERARLYFPTTAAEAYVPGAQQQTNAAMVWMFAKMHAAVADAVMHQMLIHLLETHLALEPVVIATHRALATDHPLFRLLHPHLKGTIAVNEFGRSTLVSELHARVDDLIATGLHGSLHLMTRYYNGPSYRFMESLPRQLKRRGFDVGGADDDDDDDDGVWGGPTDQLPGFLYRDYGMAVWRLTHTFVRRTLEPLYGDTAAMRDRAWRTDVGISAWIEELRREIPVARQRLAELDTFVAFVEFITQVVFQASVQHAAVSFGQYELQTFQPARPLFLTREMPLDTSLVDERYVLSSLMPAGAINLLTLTMEIVSTCCVDTLLEGHPLAEASKQGIFFIDAVAPEAQPSSPLPLAHDNFIRFQADLALLEARMRSHNLAHGFNYPYLFPSRIPRSTAA